MKYIKNVNGKYDNYRVEIIKTSYYGLDKLYVKVKTRQGIFNRFKTVSGYEVNAISHLYKERLENLIGYATDCVINYERSIEKEKQNQLKETEAEKQFELWDGRIYEEE